MAQLKPCVARIREVRRGNRNNATFILGTEWRRMGLTEHKAQSLAVRWNEANQPPLSVVELEATVESAFRHPNVYGCSGPLEQWCIGKECCPFYAQLKLEGHMTLGRTTVVDFDRLGWRSPHVTPAERLVYHAIARLEAARDVGPGGLVITSTRQLARLAGLSPSGVLHALRVLANLFLIEYRPGRARGRELPPSGSRIRREIPIPDPTYRNPGWGREVRRRLRQMPRSKDEHAPRPRRGK